MPSIAARPVSALFPIYDIFVHTPHLGDCQISSWSDTSNQDRATPASETPHSTQARPFVGNYTSSKADVTIAGEIVANISLYHLESSASTSFTLKVANKTAKASKFHTTSPVGTMVQRLLIYLMILAA